MKFIPTLVIAATVLIAPSRADETEEATEKLRQGATRYIEAFNSKDAKAIASLFLPEGEIHTASGEVVSGREAIEAQYQAIFDEDESSQAALEVGDVRFVAPGIAVEDGVVHITRADGELASYSYTALHVAQEDGSWLTARVRDEARDLAGGHAKLQALDWLIGDWLIENEGAKTYISFDWSEDGPFIDARALSESPDALNSRATMRIGWDAAKETFISWSFDIDGGHNTGTWTSAGDNAWLIRVEGVTADGERLQATRKVEVSPNGQSFTWHSQDMAINGELLPDRDIKVVKRPPSPTTDAGE
ncbi:YybH family protein [Haloferula rosea]|uniref:SgcJ/EcaC family oxidoreductase n=1 Tax=Haloferula rosea TaxID=490093 RepID=A0A934REC2_9BACT|nr:SgcJ/EcaC family oxidoreductase [Haloferula rosea]MBK1827561.1 SgcJ/EcaC family oxidoreductase [Haloferula rosea]